MSVNMMEGLTASWLQDVLEMASQKREHPGECHP